MWKILIFHTLRSRSLRRRARRLYRDDKKVNRIARVLESQPKKEKGGMMRGGEGGRHGEMTALTSHRSGETLSRGQEKDEPRPELTRQLRQGMKDSSGCQKAPRHLSAIRCIPSLFSRKLKSLPKGRPHVETVEMRARRMDSPSERGAHYTLRTCSPSLTHSHT